MKFLKQTIDAALYFFAGYMILREMPDFFLVGIMLLAKAVMIIVETGQQLAEEVKDDITNTP